MYLVHGEEPLARTSSTTGISTRCLEIEGSGFSDENEASKMYKISNKYYGTAGRKFIEELIKNYSTNDYKNLYEKLEDLKKILEEKSTCNISSYVSAVSIVTLADILNSKWIFNEEDEEKSLQMALLILDNLAKAEDIDVTEKAYEFIKNYFVSHHNYFNGCKKINQSYLEDDIYGSSYGSLGLYDHNTYYIFTNELENILTKNGFSFHKIVKEFANRGYIYYEKKDDGTFKTCSIQKKYRNKNIRVYAFPMEPVDTELYR